MPPPHLLGMLEVGRHDHLLELGPAGGIQNAPGLSLHSICLQTAQCHLVFRPTRDPLPRQRQVEESYGGTAGSATAWDPAVECWLLCFRSC